MRPSDLHRISLLHSRITEVGHLNLCVQAPKETRNGRRIIKTLVLHPLTRDNGLCPVAAFCALRDHPDASRRPPDALFVNSVLVSSPLKVSTISGWLQRLMRLSAPDDYGSSTPPSLRSVASDLALTRGASLDDVLVMGNWSSSTVFNNHYHRTIQREHNLSDRVLGSTTED
ncbi:hypothetical protein BX666DRAFT_1862215 [Dichotomocladium elegans]|nr:hypothetical protein BX666DRAFT_1862215 [Dichotomocladium elegans]